MCRYSLTNNSSAKRNHTRSSNNQKRNQKGTRRKTSSQASALASWTPPDPHGNSPPLRSRVSGASFGPAEGRTGQFGPRVAVAAQSTALCSSKHSSAVGCWRGCLLPFDQPIAFHSLSPKVRSVFTSETEERRHYRENGKGIWVFVKVRSASISEADFIYGGFSIGDPP